MKATVDNDECGVVLVEDRSGGVTGRGACWFEGRDWLLKRMYLMLILKFVRGVASIESCDEITTSPYKSQRVY
jgi:hypothetical protein